MLAVEAELRAGEGLCLLGTEKQTTRWTLELWLGYARQKEGNQKGMEVESLG